MFRRRRVPFQPLGQAEWASRRCLIAPDLREVPGGAAAFQKAHLYPKRASLSLKREQDRLGYSLEASVG